MERSIDEIIELWAKTFHNQASDLDAPYEFVDKVVTYGFGFHQMYGNVVCDYTWKGEVYNILYVFLLKHSLAYSPKQLTDLSITATGTSSAAKTLMKELDKYKLPSPQGVSNDNYQFLPLDLMYLGTFELVESLRLFLRSIKGRNREMTVNEFLAACDVESISALSPEELIDFSSRYMGALTTNSLKQLAGHPFGVVPDWKHIAALITDAYKRGLELRYYYIEGADVFPLPEGYVEDPDRLGLQYSLVKDSHQGE